MKDSKTYPDTKISMKFMNEAMVTYLRDRIDAKKYIFYGTRAEGGQLDGYDYDEAEPCRLTLFAISNCRKAADTTVLMDTLDRATWKI